MTLRDKMGWNKKYIYIWWSNNHRIHDSGKPQSIREEFQWRSSYDGVSEPLSQTSDSLQGAFWGWHWSDKGVLCDTPHLPVPLRWMKRCWKDGGFILFLINFLGEFFWGQAAGVKDRYRGTGRWVVLGYIMWNSQESRKNCVKIIYTHI